MYESLNRNQHGSRIESLWHAAQFDEPAFLRRARMVNGAWLSLLANCRRVQGEMLTMARLRLAMLGALVRHDWPAVGKYLGTESDANHLAIWFRDWNPRLRGSVEPTRSPRKIRRALQELVDSARRFNARWQAHLLEIDLAPINRLRQDYNRYYVLEKACALRSESLASADFEPLSPVTVELLAQLFPPFVILQLRR